MPAPAPHPATFRRFVPRELQAVRPVARELRSFLSAHQLPEKEIWACELALVEACNNAVQHVRAASPIEVQAEVKPNEIEICIRDQGPAFELPGQIDLPEPDQESGRGLFLIHSLMDRVQQKHANAAHCLVLGKTIPPARPRP